VSSMHNTIIDQIDQTFGERVLFKWGKHDAQKWAIAEAEWDGIIPSIKAIVEQAWDFRGRKVVFPATFKEVWA